MKNLAIIAVTILLTAIAGFSHISKKHNAPPSIELVQLTQEEINSLGFWHKKLDQTDEDQQKNLLREAITALTKAETVTLYSLEPDTSELQIRNPDFEKMTKSTSAPANYLYNHLVLGQIKLKKTAPKPQHIYFANQLGAALDCAALNLVMVFV